MAQKVTKSKKTPVKEKKLHIDTHNLILNTISSREKLKNTILDNTQIAFETLKVVLEEFALEYTQDLKKMGASSEVIFSNKSKNETELQVGGDLIAFNMHTNVFSFNHPHAIYASEYVNDDLSRANCGTIHIYNFLSDSFKYQRENDLGYLIGRIFINKDNHYFIEGKRQLGLLYNEFETAILNKTALKKILESTVLFSLDFDMLVPDYEDVSVISVAEMKENIDSSKMKSAKRLGFHFSPDSTNF